MLVANVCAPVAVKYERIKFLVIALKNAVEIYAWAPKPYHKFMAFKVKLVTMWLRGICSIQTLSFIPQIVQNVMILRTIMFKQCW